MEGRGLNTFYCADKNETIGSLVERMGKLPMDAQPGEKFIYGYNTDILGAVVEKVSGMPLDEFFRTRIFEPLKMTDTSFYLPTDKRARLATVYSLKDGASVVERAPDPALGQGDYVDGPRKCFAGGAGLLSTATDYARFLQMLLNGGELDGVRLLSPKTVELATRITWARSSTKGRPASASASKSSRTSAPRDGRAAWASSAGAAPTTRATGWIRRRSSSSSSCPSCCRPEGSTCRTSSARWCISRSWDLPLGYRLHQQKRSR